MPSWPTLHISPSTRPCSLLYDIDSDHQWSDQFSVTCIFIIAMINAIHLWQPGFYYLKRMPITNVNFVRLDCLSRIPHQLNPKNELSNVFCANSFTGFSLGQNHSLKFLPCVPCENDGLFGYGFYVPWCLCIVMRHILWRYPRVPFYIYGYTHSIVCGILLIGFNVFFLQFFIKILFHGLLYLFTEEKPSLNFDHKMGLFSFPVTTFRV